MLSVTEHQLNIIQDKTRFKVIVAGRRWGKTHVALIDSLINREHGILYNKNFLLWYVSPTYKQSKNIAWELLKSLLVPYSKVVKKINESELSVKLKNNSIICLKGADNEDSLRGSGLNHIILDEFAFMKANAWTEVLRPALSDKKGSAMFIGTPDGYNYFYDVYQRGLEKKEDNPYRSWLYKTIDSPFIDPKEIESAKSELDERTYRQEYEASFETAMGRVYYSFDRNENIKEQNYIKELPLFITVDFNVNPMKWAIIQKIKEQDFVIDEIVKQDTNTEEMSKEVLKRYGYRSYIFHGDYSGTFRSTNSRTTDYEIIKQILPGAIINTKPNPPVVDRINAVNARLCNAKGIRNLFIHPKCKHTIKDFEQVVYKQGKRDIDKTSDLDITHISDAIGYYIEYNYSLKGKPTVSHKWG